MTSGQVHRPQIVPQDVHDLAHTVGTPDAAQEQAARQRLARLGGAPGAWGTLADLAQWLCGVQGSCPPRPLDRVRVVVLAGDHGIARSGVSASPPGFTASAVRATAAGSSPLAVLAGLHGALVQVVDLAVEEDLSGVPGVSGALKVRQGSGSIDTTDALTPEQARQAFDAGMALADEAVDAGVDLLVPADLGVGATTVASALAAALLGAGPAEVVGRGSGIDDRAWMRKTAAVRDALRRTRGRQEPLDLLAALGGADAAAITGLLVQAAARRTPVLLDGVVPAVCAVLAQRIAPRARSWWLVAHRSREPAHARAVTSLQLTPVTDSGASVGGGVGALLALPTLRAAGALLDCSWSLPDPGPDDDADPDPDPHRPQRAG